MGTPIPEEDLFQLPEVKASREAQEKEVEEGSLQYAKQRYKICKQCPEFNNIVKVCTECYCFMPAKVLLKDQVCPIGLWN